MTLVIPSCIHATIMQMEELYNASTGQTLVLASDCHYHIPIIDTQQTDDFLRSLSNLAKVHLVSEWNEKSPLFQFSLDEDTVWTLKSDKQSLLFLLYDACKRQGISVYDIDFRDANATLGAVIRVGKEQYTPDGLLACMEKNEKHAVFYDLMMNSLHVSSLVRNEIESCMTELQPCGLDALYHTTLKALMKRYASAHEAFMTLMKSYNNEPPQEVVRALLHEAYQHPKGHSDSSMYGVLKQADNKLLDLILVKKLYQLRNERILIIHAGALHIQSIEPYLASLGFESRCKRSCIEHCPLFAQVELDMPAQEQAAFLKTIDPRDARVVNIQEFFASCKTLF